MSVDNQSLTRVLLVGGPTAVGKTSLGVALAQALSGEVISADSVQLYRGFRIGAATPTEEERAGVPHHLIETLAPDQKVSAADFAQWADEAIRGVVERGNTPIIVGGSGLYVRALLYGLVDAPPRDDVLRASLITFAEEQGDLALWQELQRVDPETAASLHENDRVRVVRALEVYQLTGKSIRASQRGHGFSTPRYDAAGIALTAERSWIHERINRRAKEMIASGLVDEVASLLETGASEDAQPFTAIGYRETLAYLQKARSPEGELLYDSLESLEASIATNTRNFARRQLVLFRKEASFRWFNAEHLDKALPDIIDGAQVFIRSGIWDRGHTDERMVSGPVKPVRSSKKRAKPPEKTEAMLSTDPSRMK